MGLLLDLVGGQHRRQRQAGTERLRQRQDVGHDSVALEREHRAGATETGLGFVEDQQHPALVAARLQRGEVAEGKVEDAARREQRLGDEGRRGAGALTIDQVEGVVELGAPVEAAVRAGEPGPVGVRREHRHRSDRSRTVAAAPGGVRRRGRASGHAVPALGEPHDLPAARRHLGQSQRRLVGLGARRQQQHLVQSGRQTGECLGEVDDRSRQHPGEEVVEPADHLGDDRHDLGMGVPEDRAHLATREVEHAPPGRILDERARGPLGDERRERRAVAHEMTSRSLEVVLVGHRPIIALLPPSPHHPDTPRRQRRNAS